MLRFLTGVLLLAAIVSLIYLIAMLVNGEWGSASQGVIALAIWGALAYVCIRKLSQRSRG